MSGSDPSVTDRVRHDRAYEVPTVVVGFRRLSAIQRTLTAVVDHHPGPIYVFLDHPRADNDADDSQCATVWDWVQSIAEATPRVRVRRPDRNLGVARAIPFAINWVLEENDKFILLEEDCLPSGDFYPFMSELLHRYEHDSRVSMVSGNQFLPGAVSRTSKDSYYFSRYIHIWGWGSWARAWRAYDHSMEALSDPFVQENLGTLFARPRELHFYKGVWERQLSDPGDTAWASRWLLASLLQRALCICPGENLVTNIGFDGSSTHTKRASRYQVVSHGALKWPLIHPQHVIEWAKADKWWFDHLISKNPLSRIRRYLPARSKDRT